MSQLHRLALLSALSAITGTALAQTTIRYTLWDANQLPAYQQCADAFSEQNPDIQIAIEQLGWDDYWTNLTTGFVAGTAPDVFTNHLSRYPEFVANNQLVDLQPLVERDGVDTEQYIGDLAELWTRDGARYGLPKDWDTVAVFYNVAMLEEAGIDPAVMEDWTWNPEDGGTFQEVAAQLTLDANGNNALSPDFNPNNVRQYGFILPGEGGGGGQTEWSHFAASNGWTAVNEIWGNEYYYDAPEFIETISWLQDVVNNRRLSPLVSDVAGIGANALFAAGQGAMVTDGSWMIGQYINNSPFEVGIAPLPIGPEGRKSMFNGLADSIWVGSQHQDEAWEWVKFLGSAECQNLVGAAGVVFPAIQSGVDAAIETWEARGVDVTPFTDLAAEEGATFLFPITDNYARVTSILTNALQSIFIQNADVEQTLTQANAEINALFQ
ncbi:ABC transporter substrate-binding protein [Truepera radiovictrix]|uniref:Extracellular solute-binding protein family 1 n=1 Tax=Truepera radiovictrix (strain DSM 17093 / CIP 108686 / LMG 22925 / RQ-24) TaxID=649638 RepID=D7CQV8_TRURR|nr:sugar ABC transporter substrate-binding protein [Truepera radiovictrix]ADI15092.1 extracellular solute-binding protein family 1 [Truepera radiovictrix DSM 17093]WMT56355.1 sugar ABC transporter substrate-binding protein [Truepera radiovictrix]